MKKILFFMLALVIFTTPVFATETQAIETVSTVTSVASVTGIGILLTAIIAFIISKLGWLKKTLASILNAFSVIFGKGGNIENVPLAIENIKSAFAESKLEFEKILENEKAQFENLKIQFEKQCKENNEFRQAFALLCLYSNNINPYVKNEIFRLIKGEIPYCETVDETATEIKKVADEMKQMETKVETPYLDMVTKE